MKKRTSKDIHPLFAVLFAGCFVNVGMITCALGVTTSSEGSDGGCCKCDYEIEMRYAKKCTNICSKGFMEFWTPTNEPPVDFYRTKTIARGISASIEYTEEIISHETYFGLVVPSPFQIDEGTGVYSDSWDAEDGEEHTHNTNCVPTITELTNLGIFNATFSYHDAIYGLSSSYSGTNPPTPPVDPQSDAGGITNAVYHKTNGVWSSAGDPVPYNTYPGPGAGATELQSGYTPTSRTYLSPSLVKNTDERIITIEWGEFFQNSGHDSDIYDWAPANAEGYNYGGTYTFTTTRIETLSDLITTNSLDLTELYNDLDNEPWSDWGPAGDNARELVIMDDQSVCVWKIQYRVRIPNSDPDVRYNFTDGKSLETSRGNGGELVLELDEVSAADGHTSVDAPELTQLSEGCGDCGCEGEGEIEPGGGPVLNQSFGLNIWLGRATNDPSAGILRVHEAQWTTNILSAASLRFHGWSGASEIITNSSGGIRQVKAAQILADVIVDSSEKYHVDLFKASQVGSLSNGVYTTTGSPYRTWTIANDDLTGVTFDQVNVIESRGSDHITNSFTFENTGTNHVWILTSGNGLRKHVKTISWPMPNRLEVDDILDPVTDEVLTRTTRQFTYINGNVLLTGVGRGADAAEQWTYYRYDANGRMIKSEDQNGQWTRTEYDVDGRVTAEYEGTSDNTYDRHSTPDFDPISRKTAYTYLPQGNDGATNRTYLPRQQYDYYEDNLLRTTTYEYLTNKTVTVLTPQGGDPLTNIVENYASGADAGRIKSRTNPDGTMALYEYGYDTNSGYRTNIVWRGVPNAGKDAIVKGTKEVVITGPHGENRSRSAIDIASGITVAQRSYSNHDEFARPQTVVSLGERTNTLTYICCGVESETDHEGLVTTYGYDDLKRRITVTRQGITRISELDAVSRVLKTIRQGTDSSQITNSITAYDTLGRMIASTNAVGDATLYNYSTNEQTDSVGLKFYRPLTTVTQPDGGTEITTLYLDGRIESVTGTGVHGVRHEYGFEPVNGDASTWSKKIKLFANGNDSGEWVKTYNDGLDRSVKTLYADNAASYRYYNDIGRLSKGVDPDGVVTLYQYNDQGKLEYTAIDLDKDDTIDFAGADRITQQLRSVGAATAFVGSAIIGETWVWTTDNVNSSNLVSRTEQAVDGSISARIAFGLTNTTETACGANCTATATSFDGSYTETVKTNGFVAEVTQYDNQDNQLNSVDSEYDAHGRRKKTIDARNGSTTFAYDAADRVTSVTTPVPGVGIPSQSIATHFDNMGRAWRVVQPDGASLTNEYFLTGELKKTSGARTYPVEYTYDYAGRMKILQTWQDFAAASGVATTTFNYDTNRGWLLSKQYYDGNGPSYTYHPSGKLKSRTWERGITTTNIYNNAGQLNSKSYSDSTADITYIYDRQGRRTGVVQGTSTTIKTYNDAGKLLTEAYSGGPLSGLTVTNSYDNLLRRSRLETTLNSQTSTSTLYTYDNASRLDTVANGDYSAAYSYLANSHLVEDITFKQNTTTRMTTTKAYDDINRLTSISHTDDATTLASYAYAYNAANQRTNVTGADNSYWTYEYDNLGQVTSGKKRDGNNQLFSGLQFEYDYDDIGNRAQIRSGGDNNGANLHTNNYGANLLNQYTNRSVGPYLEIHGEAATNATVTVNNQSTDRLGKFYRKELNPDNSTAAILQGITNVAVLKNAGTNNQDIVTIEEGSRLLPQNPETFTYDTDGNLLTDGLWTNTWNGENRLIQMESLDGVPDAVKRKLVFSYDYQGRRISKDVYVWNPSTLNYDLSTQTKFVYDGWNLIAEFDANTNLLMDFTWGIDLRGNLRDGGNGGLLMIQNSNSAYMAGHDGRGNLSVLANMEDSVVSARYEFAPFGQRVRESGELSSLNPIGFSSKYMDEETGYYYYGYRYYNSQIGKWISRDPIEENGGFNIYGFCRNDAVGKYDALGRKPRLNFSRGGSPTGTCGNAETNITWLIQNANGWDSGWILQKMEITWDMKNCLRNTSLNDTVKGRTGQTLKSTLVYWEAWRFVGDTVVQDAARDGWWWRKLGGKGTSGKVTWKGTAAVYLDRDFDFDTGHENPNLWTRNNPLTLAHRLRSTHKKGVSLPTASVWKVVREWGFEWNCCCQYGSRNIGCIKHNRTLKATSSTERTEAAE